MYRKNLYIILFLIGLITSNGFGVAISSSIIYSTDDLLSDNSSTLIISSHPIFGTATWSDGGFAVGTEVKVLSIYGRLITFVNNDGDWLIDFNETTEKWPDGTPFEVIITGCCPRWFWSGYAYDYINGDYNDLGNIELSYNENLNHPPTVPYINGSLIGKPDYEYHFTIESVDLEWNDIYYCIDYGDNNGEIWIGPFPTGERQIINHTWNEKGIYQIKIKSKDIYDAESDWGMLKFSVSKSCEVFKAHILDISHMFIERLPLLEKILLKL
ncbi:MAG: hypothetical protein BV457_06755 [Thermoplasmata archaeon M9B1D]|nr:MAG: hypothetical protein BV457_06755 [Thermoplasmata archaeon M9B1D]